MIKKSSKKKTISVKATDDLIRVSPEDHMKDLEKLIKSLPKDHTSLWDIANEIDSIAMKIGSVASIAVLIAESTQEPQSSAAWAISDYLTDLDKRLHELSDKVMQVHK